MGDAHDHELAQTQDGGRVPSLQMSIPMRPKRVSYAATGDHIDEAALVEPP
jgi:hypothetical protein